MRFKSGNANIRYKHGHRVSKKSNTYNSWNSMRQRCNNKNHRYYDNYGGRGIGVCERWNLFTNFLNDMGIRPEGTTLDRIEVDGNYSPENCRWATKIEQEHNKRKNI